MYVKLQKKNVYCPHIHECANRFVTITTIPFQYKYVHVIHGTSLRHERDVAK